MILVQSNSFLFDCSKVARGGDAEDADPHEHHRLHVVELLHQAPGGANHIVHLRHAVRVYPPVPARAAQRLAGAVHGAARVLDGLGAGGRVGPAGVTGELRRRRDDHPLQADREEEVGKR